jgi:hypothetical protein
MLLLHPAPDLLGGTPGTAPRTPPRHRRQRDHATCVTAFHADQREAHSQHPQGEDSEFNATWTSSPMREDGWPIEH